MGQGFGELFVLCWFVMTLGLSFWRPKLDRSVRVKDGAVSIYDSPEILPLLLLTRSIALP